MDSIIINQKKLSAEVFFAFSKLRTVKNGIVVQPCVGGDKFYWQFTDPSNGQLISHEVNRNHIAFRASIDDMADALGYLWMQFSDPLKYYPDQSTYYKALYLPYTIDDIPVDSEPNARCSNDLLIDIDGTGRIFRVGYYVWSENEDGDNEDEGFRLHGNEKDLICGPMKWDYLPVKKKYA